MSIFGDWLVAFLNTGGTALRPCRPPCIGIGHSLTANQGFAISDYRRSLFFRFTFRLPCMTWLWGRGEFRGVWLDCRMAGIGNLSAPRPTLDILARLRWGLAWFLGWCHCRSFLSRLVSTFWSRCGASIIAPHEANSLNNGRAIDGLYVFGMLTVVMRVLLFIDYDSQYPD